MGEDPDWHFIDTFRGAHPLSGAWGHLLAIRGRRLLRGRCQNAAALPGSECRRPHLLHFTHTQVPGGKPCAVAPEPWRSRTALPQTPLPRYRVGQGSGNGERHGWRRAIGLVLSLEAGGAVWIWGRRWQGEDPQAFYSDSRPTVVAVNESLADDLLGVLQQAQFV
jgi:hypothetical protein